MQVANSTPIRASTRCAECGVVTPVREVDTSDEQSSLGAGGGAVAGNEVEKRVKSTRIYSITVRLDDGSSRVINEANASTWRAGDKVKVISGIASSND